MQGHYWFQWGPANWNIRWLENTLKLWVDIGLFFFFKGDILFHVCLYTICVPGAHKSRVKNGNELWWGWNSLSFVSWVVHHSFLVSPHILTSPEFFIMLTKTILDLLSALPLLPNAVIDICQHTQPSHQPWSWLSRLADCQASGALLYSHSQHWNWKCSLLSLTI